MLFLDPNRFLVRAVAGASEVLPVLYKSDSQAAAGNKTTVAAVTGKRIKVIGLQAQSVAALGQLTFFSASTAGTQLWDGYLPDGAVSQPLVLPINPLGYFETNTGEALIARAVTATQIWNIQYITYTP